LVPRNELSPRMLENPMKRRLLAITTVLIILLLSVHFGLNWYAARVADRKIAALQTRIAPYVGVQHGPPDYNLFTNALRVKDIRIAEKNGTRNLTVDEIVINDFDFQNKIPNYMNIRINGALIDITPATFGVSAQFINQYGYRSLKLNNVLNYRYSSADKVLSINEIDIEDISMARISISMEICNIDLSIMDNFLGFLIMLPQLKVQKVKLQYIDSALCDRVMNQISTNTRKNREEIINDLLARFDILSAKEQTISGKDIQTELKKFLSKPGTLTISVAPVQPLTLASIRAASAKDLPSLLNLKVLAQ
jgi:hypothetical protein